MFYTGSKDAGVIRVTVLKTYPSSAGEKGISKRHLQLSDIQPSSASENGKALKQTHWKIQDLF